MTNEDIEIIVKYLQKAVVPQGEQAEFIRAFEHLLALHRHLAAAA